MPLYRQSVPQSLHPHMRAGYKVLVEIDGRREKWSFPAATSPANARTLARCVARNKLISTLHVFKILY